MMRQTTLSRLLFVMLLAWAGCSGSSSAKPDALPIDALAVDRGADALVSDGSGDIAASDAFSALPGLGSITGACGVLDDEEWQSSTPFFFRNTLDFGSEAYAVEKLSAGGQQIIADDNLGGDSLISEAFSFEVLHRCELAALLKTEREIDYRFPESKRTDILVSIDARKVGVSVTRACLYPPGSPYTEQEARTLLEKKLPQVLLSAEGADPADAWQRSILHILACDAQHADVVKTVYEQLDAATRDETLVIVTVTEGEDAHLYFN